MKKSTVLFSTGLACVAAAVLLAGCSKPEETALDSHAGHNHAADSHAGESGSAAEGHAGEASPKICKEHDVPLADCGICKPENITRLKPGGSLKVRLASPKSAGDIGVETALVASGTISGGVECYAEIAFNQNKLAQITAPVGGILQDVSADLGSHVEEKQTVAKIWSASIAEGVARAVLSHQTLERERRLRAGRVTSEKDLQEAEAAHTTACQHLRTLGFTEEQIDELSRKPLETVMMEVGAPFAGEIIERSAVRGTLVEPGRPLFTVADRSVMWAMLNIPEPALAGMKPGQTVELRVDSLPDRMFTGRLTWIGAEVDERSRMARARVEVANPDGLLRARMFARARVLTRTVENALLVPAAAIQRVEGLALVFVRLGDDLFDARAVTLGVRDADRLEVVAGLKAGEAVVVSRGFPLKSQLLISRLGAGCADD
jgi:cobalt-zinc-cadmium efflux system membrane fusion protein